jgi:hypothetical protein
MNSRRSFVPVISNTRCTAGCPGIKAISNPGHGGDSGD